MIRKKSEINVEKPDFVQPLFPTRRAIIGGGLLAGVVWAFSYRPAPDPNWSRLLGKAPWSARDGAALLLHGDRVWMLGGSPSNETLDLGDGWSSVDGINWRQEIDQAAWTPSANAMSVVFRERMWRMGGFVKSENRFLPIGEIWASADGRNWTLEGPTPAWGPAAGERLWCTMTSCGCSAARGTRTTKVISRFGTMFGQVKMASIGNK